FIRQFGAADLARVRGDDDHVGSRVVEVQASFGEAGSVTFAQRPHHVVTAWQSQSPGSNQRHSTSGAKIASSASKSPRRQTSNPCCATVRLELLLITPPRWRLPRKISVPGERGSWARS